TLRCLLVARYGAHSQCSVPMLPVRGGRQGRQQNALSARSIRFAGRESSLQLFRRSPVLLPQHKQSPAQSRSCSAPFSAASASARVRNTVLPKTYRVLYFSNNIIDSISVVAFCSKISLLLRGQSSHSKKLHSASGILEARHFGKTRYTVSPTLQGSLISNP